MDEAHNANQTSEPQVLGGNIELSGFRTLDGGTMIVLKKIIGSYARKFSDFHSSEKLSLQISKSDETYTLLGAVIISGTVVNAEHSDKNVFFLVDNVLKKIEDQL